MHFLKNLTLRGKLALIVGWATASMVILITLSLWIRWQNIREEPKTLVLNLVEVAAGILDRYHKQEQVGALTREQAQKLAIETLRNMRRQDLYFIVFDKDQRLLLHAERPELENQGPNNSRDAHNLAAISAELVQAAQRDGSGFVDYDWPRPGTNKPVQKIAYARSFDPWDWVLASGVYVDEARAEFVGDALREIFLTAALALPLLALFLWLRRGLRASVDNVLQLAQNLASGNLSHEAPINSSGELGTMTQALNQTLKNIRAVLQADEVNWGCKPMRSTGRRSRRSASKSVRSCPWYGARPPNSWSRIGTYACAT